jgi:hypothetical protein
MEANNFNAIYGSCFRECAAAPEIAGRYEPLANCLRSGGLAAWSRCQFELRNPG